MNFKVAADVENDANIFLQQKRGKYVASTLIRQSISKVLTDGKQVFARKFVKCGQKYIL
jgi:hypothetical protein